LSTADACGLKGSAIDSSEESLSLVPSGGGLCRARVVGVGVVVVVVIGAAGKYDLDASAAAGEGDGGVSIRTLLEWDFGSAVF
jgi:hypothetical protein